MLFQAIQPNHTYKSQAVIPFPKGNPQGKNEVLFLLTPSFKESLALISDAVLDFKHSYFNRYSIDTRYHQKIGTKMINQNQISAFKDEFAQSCANSKFAYIPSAMLSATVKKKYNMIVDLGHWNNLYFKNRKVTTRENAITSYLDFIMQKINNPIFTDYSKTLVIPANQWADKNSFGVQKDLLDDPISILLAVCYKYPAMLSKFKGLSIYIIDPSNGNMLLVNPDEFDEKFYSKLKATLFKFQSIKFAGDDQEADVPGTTAPSVKNTSVKNTDSSKPSNNVADNTEIVTNSTDFKDKSDTLTAPPRKNEELVVPASNTPSPEKSAKELLQEELAEEINSIDESDEDDESFDESEDNLEDTKKEIKRNVFVTKFRPEFSTDQQKRISMLTTRQDTLLTQSISSMESKIIEPASLKGIVNTKNQTILNPKAMNFTRSYNEKKLDSDIDNAIGALAHATYPIFITGKSIEDSSDTLSAKKTYTYNFEDYRGQKFSCKFDIPIILDDHYIYLNGIKSVIENQLIPVPIIKSAPDEVQIIGQYNKIYLHRKDTGKLDAKTEIIKRFFLNQERSAKFHVKIGNCVMLNKNFETPLDFDNISKNIYQLTVNGNKFIFDLQHLMDTINPILEKNGLKPIIDGYTADGKLVVGYNTKTKHVITVDEKNGECISNVIIAHMTPEDKEELLKTSAGTHRFTWIQARMLKRFIPAIFFMLYCEGMTTVLQKLKVNYEIVEPNTKYDEFNKGVIKAKDKWILWDKEPMHVALLLNGCVVMPFNEFTLAELDSKNTYIDMVDVFFKDSRKSFALDQFKDFMVDPISEEILKDMNLPTNIVDLFIVAAIMLSGNSSDSVLDMHNIRLRNNEIFAQFVYKEFTSAYLDYRKSQYKKKADRLKVNPYLVTQNINGSNKTKQAGCKLIEGAASLNPILELEKQNAVSYRGPSGMNLDDCYTLQKRAYNPTMTGIMGIYSSPDANIGIQRSLTLDPNIKSTRGYLEAGTPDVISELHGAELFSAAELLSPIGVMHDDGNRTSMAAKQSKYMVMTDAASPVLIGNRVESAIPYYLSRAFIITAQDNGKVIDITDENHGSMVIVEYKNGKHDSFTLAPTEQKNSAGGFYIESKFETKLKLGDTFKKGEVLAYNPLAFRKNDDDLSASMNIGVLSKIAIAPTGDEYEDSAPISESLAKKLATTIVMEQSVVIGSNARVERIAKVGDHVNVGDVLAVFDNWQDDPEAAAWLNELSNDLGENVSEHVATTTTSEYAGVITDIKYYSAVDLEELSPTLRPYVEKYWKKIENSTKTLNKYKNDDDFKTYVCGQLVTEKAGKTDAKNGKIFGRSVEDGVLVRFFIKHKDIVKKGDKITHYTALKGIVSNVIPQELTPFSEYRKDEPIDALMAPGAVLARKTPSIILAMFGNKVLIELKRHIADFYLK